MKVSSLAFVALGVATTHASPLKLVVPSKARDLQSLKKVGHSGLTPIDYLGSAFATLSNNVAWEVSSPEEADLVVDGDSSAGSKGVAYTSKGCNVGSKDIGSITVDLGYEVGTTRTIWRESCDSHLRIELILILFLSFSPLEVDNVRVFLRGGQNYSNIFMNVWNTDDIEPMEPLNNPITVSPTASPTTP